jgi:SsrA-binding protein
MQQTKVHIKNKKASFNYELIDKYTAGIVLLGTEIKSLRLGKASLVDSFCYFHGEELYLQGLHISEYENRGYANHIPTRERKLLLNRQELRKLKKKVEEKGMTIVATGLFINDRGLAKVNIALAKGKAVYDKRDTIKRKDQKREMDRAMKM